MSIDEDEAAVRLRQDALEWCPFDEEILALDFHRGQYLRVNRAGALLWNELAEGATRTDLVRFLRQRFRISDEAASTGVDAFLSRLSEHGLLAR